MIQFTKIEPNAVMSVWPMISGAIQKTSDRFCFETDIAGTLLNGLLTGTSRLYLTLDNGEFKGFIICSVINRYGTVLLFVEMMYGKDDYLNTYGIDLTSFLSELAKEIKAKGIVTWTKRKGFEVMYEKFGFEKTYTEYYKEV